MLPFVMMVGRISPDAPGVRGDAYAAGQRYSQAVVRAGGVPFVLPPITDLVADIDEVVRRVDAVILHGGGDIDPRHYGHEPTTETLYAVVPEHDEVELAVVRAALVHDVPLLAICRGMQVLNVALGGTLLQDIGTEAHWRHHRPVALSPGSLIAETLGTDVAAHCHCVHHQALDTLGDGLVVSGRSQDGVIHAVELPSAGWLIAVQWHPEDTAADDPQQQALFNALVEQSRSRRA